jgi:hypothetical protein
MNKIMQKLLAQAFEEYDFALGALMAVRLLEGGRADKAGAGTRLIGPRPRVTSWCT